MSRYNHFAKSKYGSVRFSDLKVGDKFRMDKFSGKRRRSDIVMVKTGELSYMELKSKREWSLYHNNIDVATYEPLTQTSNHPLTY